MLFRSNLPLRERVAPRTAGSPRNRILASLATLLLVVGIVVLLVAPELVGLGQAEEPAEGSPQVASVTEVPNNSGLPQDTPVEQPVATEIAPTVETGVELPVGASEELPPAATEIEEAPEVEVIVPPVVTALPALAIPGGVWTYKAPEQLMAGAPSDKLVATRQWAVRELAESIQQVRERYRLLDDAGPQQVVALAFSDSLERELDKYLPPPVEFERTAEGGHVRPAALVFAEFQTPAGRYLLITQALPGSTDDEVRLVPGRPQTYVLVPGAIQEETIVLDGRRRAWPQPN